ncbi:hypothetical protein C1N32_16860 [Vibrio diazotrophicus]|uniref:Uncharacterized protein n=1 Tax=Vibrio diazotrophicus TaxID=685 RepID=A0A2J8HYD7_VIBDI|nr:hypothetical protein [Vibrio diazotrophicus]PNI03271.1 hypothetical protein C1N32_16860 [Vibrio diazotrophicus]
MARNISVSPDKFKCFVRYMIQAAKQKRCVSYVELENCFGLSHDYVGWYAGVLGNYCLERELPMLNGLIVSSSECIPSEGFNWYEKEYGKSWGEIISECWKYFHVTSSRTKQSQHYSKRDADVAEFLESCDIPSYKK